MNAYARPVSIAGIGSTRFGKMPERSIESLALEAAVAAIEDAGVERRRIGAVYLGNFVGGALVGQEILAGLLGDQLDLHGVPCTKVEGACASGGIALRHACLAVATGQCDVALAVGVEKMSHAPTAQVTSALNCAMDNRADGPAGLTFPGFFGLVWGAHAARYGTTRRDVSAVVRKNKANGMRNPLAQQGRLITDEEIDASALIADPLRLHDCCPVSDGAAAVVVVARDAWSGSRSRLVDVLASVQTSGPARIAGFDDPCSFPATVRAAQLAFAQSGITASELAFVELHDCFSIAEIVDSEDLGIVPRGQGHHWAAEGRTAVGGDMPINPSGGLLAKGHPVGATGLGQAFEAVRQLRGEHANQVRDAVFGMTHNLGGTGVACTVSILARGDR
jgi:acetyl-CoA C-acetyltransferase